MSLWGKKHNLDPKYEGKVWLLDGQSRLDLGGEMRQKDEILISGLLKNLLHCHINLFRTSKVFFLTRGRGKKVFV